MTRYRVKTIANKKIWEEFVLSQKPQSFLQSWHWGETNRLMGNKIFRLGFFEKNKLIGSCLAIKQKARRGDHLVVPGGPLIDWQKNSLVKFVLATLKNLGKKEKIWFIRVRPELLDSLQSRRLFANLGFIPAPMHLHAENTWVLDTAPNEEALLAQMRKSTRYLVRKSLKMGLIFKETTDPQAAKILTKLQEETIARHKFVGFPEKIFQAQLETFAQDKQAGLFLCQKGKEVLAAAIIIFYGGQAYYHHSGASNKIRTIPASYFLQWKIIQAAKKRGCRHYNFWGIAPADKPKHRFAGVTLFKKGFGGQKIDWLHAQDLPLSPFYWLTYVFEKIRKTRRSL